LFQFRIHDPSQYNDDDSVISDPVIKSTHILQACAKHWLNLPEQTEEAWKLRTLQVNSLPVPGAYTTTPINSRKKSHINYYFLFEIGCIPKTKTKEIKNKT
jgi:hypothetical protein